MVADLYTATEVCYLTVDKMLTKYVCSYKKCCTTQINTEIFGMYYLLES